MGIGRRVLEGDGRVRKRMTDTFNSRDWRERGQEEGRRMGEGGW